MKFWGVRGSIPTPGPETSRWGGNTSCVCVTRAGSPPLVLDCGTGARPLSFDLVAARPRELDLLYTHLHMDHLFGFPFFLPIYTPGYEVRVGVPAYTEEEAREKIARYLNGVYHPSRLPGLPARVTFHPVRAGHDLEVGGFSVRGLNLNHPGGAVGYRIEAEGAVFCYVTDTSPFAQPGEGVCAGRTPTDDERKLLGFVQGADLVVFDTMYELDEYLEKMTWGHSYPEYAEAICVAAGVRHLVLFHHRPEATDAELDARSARWAAHPGPLVVEVAREGDAIALPGRVAAERAP